MERVNRQPFQGIINIIRFNWHYYAIAIALAAVALFTVQLLPANWHLIVWCGILLALLTMFVSLAVSWYVYDRSDLYTLNWLNELNIDHPKRIININAGFDETSALLAQRYPQASLTVLDFYNPDRHTEISIERARKAYPPYSGTKTVDTTDMQLEPGAADHIFLIFAAHEIRNMQERVHFFRQLRDALTTGGKIIVTEHLRDMANFIAYNIGFFHFHSPATWRSTFSEAGLKVEKEIKLNPFVSSFVLVPFN